MDGCWLISFWNTVVDGLGKQNMTGICLRWGLFAFQSMVVIELILNVQNTNYEAIRRAFQ